MQIIVNEQLVNYETNGQGKTVLLLHGWGDNFHTFDHLIDVLKMQYQTIALDLPGFGKSSDPKGTWDFEEFAQFVQDFLSKLSLQPYAIIGHSNGGAIATYGVGNTLLRAEKLVLIASSGIRSDSTQSKKLLRMLAKTAKIATKPLPPQVQTKLKRHAYKTIGSDMFVAEQIQDTYKKIVAHDIQTDATRIMQPTALIYGSDDTATPPSYGERFHALIANSQLHIIDKAGHFVHHEKPRQVEEIVQSFLAHE